MSSIILIVEDDPDMVEFYKAAIESLDFEHIVCTSSDDVVDKYLDFQPSIILMDIDLPGSKGTGIDITREIKRLPEAENTIIMIMSGHEDNELIEEAFRAGATDFSIKPINPTILINRLRYWHYFHQTSTEGTTYSQQLGAVFAHIPTTILVATIDGTIIRFNDYAIDRLELNEELLKGQNLMDILDLPATLLSDLDEKLHLFQKTTLLEGIKKPVDIHLYLTAEDEDEGVPAWIVAMIDL
ncbi:MAG: response regulator [Gammaproteobacteria bacterium]|nr:response regulator [Gammaproteobacteria bacterium]